MNRGLWIKALREVWFSTLLFGLGLLCFEAILAAVLPTFFEQLERQVMEIPFFQTILRALLGTDVGERLGPMTIGSLAWVHPIALSLLWAHEIVHCTRLPAAEIDRGTVDVLLGLPVSRWSAYVTETAVFALSGLFLLTAALAGHLMGRLAAPAEFAPTLGRLLVVLGNLFCMYLTVGGVAYFVSSLSERRGRAVGAVFGVVLGSFFLQFLGQFWEPAAALGFLGLLHYYQPFEVLTGDGWPLGDMTILLAVGVVFWLAGGWIFDRRDICTV